MTALLRSGVRTPGIWWGHLRPSRSGECVPHICLEPKFDKQVMSWLKKVRALVRRWNDIVDSRRAPPKVDVMGQYRKTLSECDCSFSLHLGSGRDKYDVGPVVSGDKGRVVAFDLDTQGLLLNKMSLKARGDAVALPFKSDTFSLVFSEYTFEHLTKPWDVLTEIDRVLRPQGSVVILVPNRRHYYTLATKLTPLWFHRWWLNAQGVERVDLDTFPTRHRWGGIADFQRSAASYGWQIAGLWSTPGPTGYTRWLPIHPLFTLVDRMLSRWPTTHLAYVVHFVKPSSEGLQPRNGSNS